MIISVAYCSFLELEPTYLAGGKIFIQNTLHTEFTAYVWYIVRRLHISLRGALQFLQSNFVYDVIDISYVTDIWNGSCSATAQVGLIHIALTHPELEACIRLDRNQERSGW